MFLTRMTMRPFAKGRIVAALRNAIVNNYEGFEVNYQPIVDCQTEQIIGAEALMRFP